MELKIHQTSQFKKDLKKIIKQGRNLQKLDIIIGLLATGAALPSKNRDHALMGNLVGFRDCHIEPDWLLIYKIDRNILILTLSRTGTHAEVLNK